MKKLTLIMAILLAGCSNGYSERNFPVLPKELQDCKFYHITNDAGAGITVARCPNSTTATRFGKNGQSIVVDGVTYEPVKEEK